MLVLKPANSGGYRAYWKSWPGSTEKLMGEVFKLEDGYYVYWPGSYLQGCYTEWFLRSMADKLWELNKDWDEIVQRQCTGPTTDPVDGRNYVPFAGDPNEVPWNT